MTTPNEPNALSINYYLRDSAGSEGVDHGRGPVEPGCCGRCPERPSQGLNTVRWDMRDTGGKLQPRGEYLVTVDIDGRKFAKTATIRSPDR